MADDLYRDHRLPFVSDDRAHVPVRPFAALIVVALSLGLWSIIWCALRVLAVAS
jgi:hypothetical protein